MMRKVLIGAAFVVTFLIGVGVGGAGTAAEDAAPAAQTVTEERVVYKTPQACIEALDLASEGFTLAATGMGIMTDVLEAAAAFDIAGIRAGTPKLQAITAELQEKRPQLAAASSECRAAA